MAAAPAGGTERKDPLKEIVQPFIDAARAERDDVEWRWTPSSGISLELKKAVIAAEDLTPSDTATMLKFLPPCWRR